MFLRIRYDYWLHLLAGYSIMLTSLIFTDYVIASYTTYVFATGKEFLDEFYLGSSWDWLDIIYTLLGAAFAFGVYLGSIQY